MEAHNPQKAGVNEQPVGVRLRDSVLTAPESTPESRHASYDESRLMEGANPRYGAVFLSYNSYCFKVLEEGDAKSYANFERFGFSLDGMKWLLGTYTSRFNRRHKLFGHLFSGRYKSLFVDGSGNGYLKTVCDYVHLNPARAKLVGAEQKLSAYRWCSYGEYLKAKSGRQPWLRVDRLLGEH